MHSCFTSCIFAAWTLDFAIKFRLVFRYEAVVFRRYVLALLSVGLLRKFEAYLVYLSLIWTKIPQRFSFFQKFRHFTYMLLWFSRANWWHAQSFFSSVGSCCFSSGRFHCFLNQSKSVLQQNSLESHSPAQKVVKTRGTNLKLTGKCNTYLSLTEFEGRTVSYGPSFFLLDLWPKREACGP